MSAAEPESSELFASAQVSRTTDSSATAAACAGHSPPGEGTVRRLVDPVLLGMGCGVLSAIFYTAANICLRRVADSDPFWVSCLKAMPTVVVTGAFLLMLPADKRGTRLTPKMIAQLIGIGLLAQMGANVSFQFALWQVGLALAVPLSLGAMITTGAIMGRVWMGEHVSRRTVMAIAMLLVAVTVLSVGAERHGSSTATEASNTFLLTLGILAASGAGAIYALLGAVLRRMSRRQVPVSKLLLVVTLTGTISLGLASLYHAGWEQLVATPRYDLGVMLAAGVFNAVAFISLTKALDLAPMAQVNAINALQTALAALAGIMIFDESLTITLTAGLALTVVGLLMLDRPRLSATAARPNQPIAAEPATPADPDSPSHEPLRAEPTAPA